MSTLAATSIVLGILVLVGGPILWWIFFKMDEMPPDDPNHPPFVPPMSAEALQAIEARFGIQLPQAYRQLLLTYPFAEDSSAVWYLEPDPELLTNQAPGPHFMIHHRKGRWMPGKQHFKIGTDGSEFEYYLDLSSPGDAVLKFDLETGILATHAADLAEFVREIERIDEEGRKSEIEMEKRIAEREAKMSPLARWWDDAKTYVLLFVVVFVIVPLIAASVKWAWSAFISLF